MSAIIGGPLKCLLHEFETENVQEWNEHCKETGHTETGDTQCINCGNAIHFENIPYQDITPRGKQIQLKCEQCYNNSEDLNKLLYGGQVTQPANAGTGSE